MSKQAKALEAAEAALADAVRNGASDDELYDLDAAVISAELAVSEASY